MFHFLAIKRAVRMYTVVCIHKNQGFFLAYVNGCSVPLYFKDIDLSGKIVLQASFEFTTLENTRDLGSYIPNSAKRLGDGAEAVF